MEIQEWLVGGAFVVGGVVYGASQVSLGDVLSDDLRHISEVSLEERPAYMDSVVKEFQANFSEYAIPVSEDTAYIGLSTFSASAKYGEFKEVVNQQEKVPSKHVKLIATTLDQASFCEQAEMTMFTDQGWSYEFSIRNSNGSHIHSITCTPSAPKLRLS